VLKGVATAFVTLGDVILVMTNRRAARGPDLGADEDDS
jgi:hypothetical protein